MSIRDQAENLEHHGCPYQRGVAGLIVRRGNFYDVAADEIESAQAAQEALRFQRGDAADFRRPSSRCIDGVETVNVERYVSGTVADNLAGFFDDSLNTERCELLHEHHAHAVRQGKLDAIHKVLPAANADLNRAFRVQ